MDTVRQKAIAEVQAVTISHRVMEAFAGAKVVYAKSWAAKLFMAPEKDIAGREQYRGKWIVNDQRWRELTRYLHAVFAGAPKCDCD